MFLNLRKLLTPYFQMFTVSITAMRNKFLYGLIFLIIAPIFGCDFFNELKENEKTLNFGLAWGLMKYHLPQASNMDWDSVFIQTIQNEDYERLENLEKFLPNENKESKPDTINSTFPFKWSIGKVRSSNTSKFHALHSNLPFDNFYVDNDTSKRRSRKLRFNEKEIDLDSYDPILAKLAFMRFWCAIVFYYPHFEKISENWYQGGLALLENMESMQSKRDFIFGVKKLLTVLNDAHAQIIDGNFSNMKYSLPFSLTMVDGDVVVCDTVANEGDTIFPGSKLLEVNHKPVNFFVDSLSKITSSSSENGRNLGILFHLENADSSFSVLHKYSGENEYPILWEGEYIHFSNNPRFQKSPKITARFDEKIGYMNLTYIPTEYIDKVMSKFMDCNALIFDLRGYPQETVYPLMDYFAETPKEFVRFSKPDADYPGRLIIRSPDSLGGNRNIDRFTGEVFCLINEQTFSHAEYTAMAFKKIANATLVGSPTMGTNGNVNFYPLLKGVKVNFTQLAVYWPNGEGTQGVGILPDFPITPTLDGIKNEKDEILQKAIQLANSNRSSLP